MRRKEGVPKDERRGKGHPIKGKKRSNEHRNIKIQDCKPRTRRSSKCAAYRHHRTATHSPLEPHADSTVQLPPESGPLSLIPSISIPISFDESDSFVLSFWFLFLSLLSQQCHQERRRNDWKEQKKKRDGKSRGDEKRGDVEMR